VLQVQLFFSQGWQLLRLVAARGYFYTIWLWRDCAKEGKDFGEIN